MIECPVHKKAYLYKEILDNDMIMVGCTAHRCEWKSGEFPRHDFKHISTMKEIKLDWGEA